MLIVSDLHYNRPSLEWVRMTAKSQGMAVAIVGDLIDMCRCDSAADAKKQQTWLLDWMRRCTGRLFVVSGNHDVYPSVDRAEWLQSARRDGVSVDGDVAEFQGRRFALVPYSPGTSRMLGRLFAQPPPDIVLHHEPPARTRIAIAAESGSDFGSEDLRVCIDAGWRPKLVFSGHVHRPDLHAQWVQDTLCVNVAGDCRLCPPSHAILDLGTGVIERFSPRAESVHQNPEW